MIGTLRSGSSTPILEARGMEVVWSGGVRAVQSVDLSLEPGEVVGIVGESGSGKTSVIMGLLGMVPLAHGQVLFQGEAIDGGDPDLLRRFRSAVQPVFQLSTQSLNPARTVGQALEEALHFHASGVSAETSARRPTGAAELLERVGLNSSLASRRPLSLSGGERQRVSIARALAVNPQILLLDEPTSALDVSVQAGVLSVIRQLNVDYGLTVLLVSHDLALVGQFCARIHVMLQGRIVESAPSAQLFREPAHPFTRALLDARNAVVSGTVTGPSERAKTGL